MQNILKHIRITFIAVSILLIQVLAGCSGSESGKQNTQLQAAQEKQIQEQESEKLKKTEEQIEKLFETLGGPSVKTEKSGEEKTDEEQESGQKEGTNESGQQKETQQSGGQKEEQQSSQDGGSQKKGSSQQGSQESGEKKDGKQTVQQSPDKWTEVGSIISKLHYQWNDLMPEIAKKGADMKLVDNFDNALNDLTTIVESKDQEKVLTSANKLYSYVPDLYSLYRVKMSPEVKRMIYYTRNIILESGKEGWDQVGKDNEALGKSWSLFRNTLEKEQKKIEDKLDFSIYELKKVVSEKNSQLSGIKGRIVLNNIQELQKSFEEKK